MSKATSLLLSFSRQDNLKKIISNLKSQTEKPQIFLWNNSQQDSKKYDIDLQINSSANLMCWPRWFMANYANTEYVFSLDDDLIFTDENVIGDCIRFMEKNECGAIGYSGVLVNRPNDVYSRQKHCFSGSNDRFVDILKGGFIFARKKDLSLPEIILDSSLRDPRIEDDIIISSLIKGKKIVPSFLRDRLKMMEGYSYGLHKENGHYESRTKYMNLFLKDE